jgi:hypothetical protein
MLNQWAKFLAAEKLRPNEESTLVLLELAEALARTNVKPRRNPYAHRQLARKTIVNVAMDLGIDLPNLGDMGRGLLDMWVEEYARRFGSAHGTNAWAELKRRTVVTKLAKERKNANSMLHRPHGDPHSR